MPPSRQKLLASLALANKAATAHATVKRELRAGALDVADALVDDRAASMAICKLLAAVPGWGPTRVSEALEGLRIGSHRAVGQLTARQRQRLGQVVDEGPQRIQTTLVSLYALSPA